MAIALIVVAAFLGGGIPAISKIALREVPPFAFTLLRFAFAAAVLIPLYLRERPFRTSDLIKLAPLSLLATANVTLFVFGVQRTTATVAQMLYAGVPLVAGIFSYLLLREKLSAKKVFGIIIGGAGVLAIVALPVWGRQNAFEGDLVGNLILLAALCSHALYTVFSKRYQETWSPLGLTTFFIVTTLVFQAALVPIEYVNQNRWWESISRGALFGIAYVGIIGTATYYLLYQHAIKHASPVVASMILYLQPAFAYVWAAVLLGEQLTAGFIMGALLAFLGVWLVMRPS